jgi:oligopeptide/dipeptide ABC transporter ATP-binding protein
MDLLRVEGLKTHFRTSEGAVRAVDGVDYGIEAGKTLGLVGESGCGKSVTALSIMRLLPRNGRIVSGRVLFRGQDLASLQEEEMEEIRGDDIAMIFQEPMTSLNPVFTCGDQVAEPLMRHRGLSKKQAWERVVELFKQVGIPSPDKRVNDYPHQLSGGMRQRVMIAMALSCEPKMLIADEPTTALDVTIQAQILELIGNLKTEYQMATLLITHDLGVIAEMADDVCVMYAGKIVERGTVLDIFKDPKHPYTQGLLNSIPSRAKKGERLNVIKGAVPHPLNLPPGCTFAPRCPHVMDVCRTAYPASTELGGVHSTHCYLYSDAKESPEEDTTLDNRGPAGSGAPAREEALL